MEGIEWGNVDVNMGVLITRAEVRDLFIYPSVFACQ
jgi:hypothetical protein